MSSNSGENQSTKREISFTKNVVYELLKWVKLSDFNCLVYLLNFILLHFKKKNFRSGKNISRISLKNILKWDKWTENVIHGQLDIKLGRFMENELYTILKSIKSRKAAGLDEIPPEVWKTRKSDYILLWLCNTVYKQTGKLEKKLHLPLP